MDAHIKIKFMDYMIKMANGQYDNLPTCAPMVLDFNEELEISSKIPKANPNDLGISNISLLKLFKDLSDKDIYLNGLMILRYGNKIVEGYKSPFNEEFRHISHSVCKSITGMAVGIAIGEKLLSINDLLVDIFPEKVGLLTSKGVKKIKVRHLLTMTSGIKFNELSTAFETDWVKGYMESDVHFEPGSKFSYNSLNTYMLSAIIKRKTGKGLLEYLDKKLFEPMGINSVTWETCPMGIEKGGWGLKITLEDMAKLGQLYLQQGRWNIKGTMRSLIPSAYVSKATKPIVTQNASKTSNGYGYQVWSLPKNRFVFNGMLGQNVFVFPDRDMVIAMVSGSDNLFMDSKATDIIMKFANDNSNFSDEPIKENSIDNIILKKTLENMIYDTPLKLKKPTQILMMDSLKVNSKPNKVNNVKQKYLDKMTDRSYGFGSGFASVLPFMLQVVYNNYSKGVNRIIFSKEDNVNYISFNEVSTANKIGIDLNKPWYGTYNLHGQSFKIGVLSKLTKDEDDVTVLKILISFAEQANVRIIKIFFVDDKKIKAEFSENPSLESIFTQVVGEDSALVTAKLPAMNTPEYMRYRFDKFVAPWSYGYLD